MRAQRQRRRRPPPRGAQPITGKRGTTSRFRDQLHRLFSTTIRCSYSDEDEGQAAGVGYPIAYKHPL